MLPGCREDTAVELHSIVTAHDTVASGRGAGGRQLGEMVDALEGLLDEKWQ